MSRNDHTSLIRVASLADVKQHGPLVVTAGQDTLALFHHNNQVYAVDNRCPHMGFPLSKGSCKDGILTCHWHHARFDMSSGGTFDPFADDVRTYPVVLDGESVYVDVNGQHTDKRAYWKARLQDGLEQELSLVTVKAVLALLDLQVSPAEILALGGRFGGRYRAAGWGPGLTILTAMANVLGDLAPDDRVLAIYHGLVHVSSDCSGQPPRLDLDALPTREVPVEQLRGWFRNFVEVRNQDGAERVLRTAIAAGATPAQVADMLLAAATDHFFLNGGHTLDFINKAFEMLDRSGWDEAANVLPALLRGLTGAARAEENDAWRNPIDLVSLVEPALSELATLPQVRASVSAEQKLSHEAFSTLVSTLLGDDPVRIVHRLLETLRSGIPLLDVSRMLAYAAALRVAHFHTSNEFGDWITVLHTFTYCNALHQSLPRAPSAELARGIFHGAMSLYLDRFLNTPAARLPDARSVAHEPQGADELLAKLVGLTDELQRVGQSAAVTYRYLSLGYDERSLLQALAHVLLREDGEFHSYQMLEAGFHLYHEMKASQPAEARLVLVAVARYLAAHAPTSRAMLQTARIAMRLHRGEDLTVVD